MRRLIVIAFALAVFAPNPLFAQASTAASTAPVMESAYARKIHIRGIANIAQVDESLYRGGQPQLPALAELQKLGITEIVSLRGEAPVLRENEKSEAERLGIHFISIPIGGFQPPSKEQVAQFLSLFGGKSHPRVFVHCHYGEDRTGVFVASYRMAVDHWPVQQALNEMYLFGFKGFWHPAMIRFVREFPQQLASAPALSGPGLAADSSSSAH
jgi:tyrosine-protein phosphatase SIW14